MAATTDLIAGGRLILGVGCGWHEPEYRAFGFPFDHRVGRFEEALRIIVPLVHGQRVTFDGEYGQVHDAQIRPTPIRPDLPILVAAKGERMLRLTARYADAWQTAWFGRPDGRYRERHDALLVACESEGRDSATLEVTVGVEVTSDEDGAASVAIEARAVADTLLAWQEIGADHVQLAVNPGTPESFATVLEGIRAFRG
jgi:alkanesulfonate monooxygenase SsuD/methylene tetrahydromethanopterin reductase-like flavin-dependent oxidoreductase (luciferase family)